MKERVTEMTTKITRLVPLAIFLWGHRNSLEYSEKVRDLANLHGQSAAPDHAACVAMTSDVLT
jgi:hypothetical protein